MANATKPEDVRAAFEAGQVLYKADVSILNEETLAGEEKERAESVKVKLGNVGISATVDPSLSLTIDPRSLLFSPDQEPETDAG